jgi:hypothetical protein
LQIDAKRHAKLTITNYSSRGFSKFLLGPLSIAMSDEIKAKVSTEEREFLVQESTRVPFRDINSVAKLIGQAAFDGLTAP